MHGALIGAEQDARAETSSFYFCPSKLLFNGTRCSGADQDARTETSSFYFSPSKFLLNQGWPEAYDFTVHDRILGDFPAKNTVYTLYIYGCGQPYFQSMPGPS